MAKLHIHSCHSLSFAFGRLVWSCWRNWLVVFVRVLGILTKVIIIVVVIYRLAAFPAARPTLRQGQFRWHLLVSILLLQFVFHFFDKASKHTNFFIAVSGKVKAKLLSKPELEQVVIKGLLRHLNFLGRIFEGPSLELKLPCLCMRDNHPIIQLSPRAHLLNDILYSSLLGAFVLLPVGSVFGRGHRLLWRCCATFLPSNRWLLIIHLETRWLLFGMYILASLSVACAALTSYGVQSTIRRSTTLQFWILNRRNCGILVAVLVLWYADRLLAWLQDVLLGRWRLLFYLDGATVVCVLIPGCALPAHYQVGVVRCWGLPCRFWLGVLGDTILGIGKFHGDIFWLVIKKLNISNL